MERVVGTEEEKQRRLAAIKQRLIEMGLVVDSTHTSPTVVYSSPELIEPELLDPMTVPDPGVGQGFHKNNVVLPCIVASCDQEAFQNGYCRAHFEESLRFGLVKTPKCSIKGCHRKVKLEGLCQRHHRNMTLYGDPLLSYKTCIVDGCKDRYFREGFCERHFHSYDKYGHPQYMEQLTHCTVIDCSMPHEAMGLCSMHLYIKSKYGTTHIKEELLAKYLDYYNHIMDRMDHAVGSSSHRGS